MKKPTYLVLFLLSISSLTFAQKTYVPDNNFEQALIDLGYDNVLDDSVLTANIFNVTTLDVRNKNISDLTGIEAFAALEILYCYDNQLTNLNVTNNNKLTQLHCQNNLITNLDISNLPALIKLYCSYNQLTSLDITNNTALTELWVSSNKLRNLNVLHHSKLEILGCDNIQLTSLDISNNYKLAQLYCSNNELESLDVSNNTKLLNLYCGANPIKSLDVSNNILLTNLFCVSNQLTSLDVDNNIKLYQLSCGENNLSSLNVSNNTELIHLEFLRNKISSLDISKNTLLRTLICYSNQLTSLYVSSNLFLSTIWCNNNQLTNLNVSNNTMLNVLLCNDNQLTNLDVSKNVALTYFRCYNNELTGLNVRNGNNINFTDFIAEGNPNLTCIQVDNAAWSTANWPNKDATASYSENCSNSNTKTYIPDDNFEQALIDLGYDDVLDDYVTTDNIENVTSLNVNSKNISDLTGIEAFIALTSLYCGGNQLTSLNLSNNTLLTQLVANDNNLISLNITKNILLSYLTCTNNQLSSLNITTNTKLELIGCENNQITNLDLSNKSKLNSLYCNDNQLSSLDLSNCPDLKYIHCENNKLTHLDVSNCSLLLYIYCENNQLTHLDVATNTALGYIVCNNNQLIGLDFSNNNLLLAAHCNDNQLKSFNIKNGINNRMYEVLTYNNPNLTCIQVDNAAIAEAHWRQYADSTASFSENCGSTTGTDADGDGVDDGDDDFPNDPTMAFANYFPATGYGSLGFEDLWPGKGDYDFNDLVLDYRFITITNASNKVVQIVQTFVVKASGAALKNGFGFNLPDANAALVNNLNIIGCDLREGYVNLKSNGTESGQSKPTIIAFDNVFNLLPHPGSGVGVNTETASPFVPYDTLIITLTPNSLNYTMNDFSLETWNPFIIINGERGKEVHLIDNPPTDLANRSYFGTWEDKSNQGTGKYYRTSNGSPWAINIAEPFVWPIERIEIQLAYLHFLEWAISSGAVYPDWYKDFSGYRNNDKLYIQR